MRLHRNFAKFTIIALISLSSLQASGAEARFGCLAPLLGLFSPSLTTTEPFKLSVSDQALAEVATTVHATKEQVESLRASKGLIRYNDFLKQRKKITNSKTGYLLGPRGDDYYKLRSKKILHFYDAYYAVGMDPMKPLTDSYVTQFLTRLITSHENVLFLIPNDLTADTHTAQELRLLMANPELLGRVVFIYGGKGH